MLKTKKGQTVSLATYVALVLLIAARRFGAWAKRVYFDGVGE